MAVLEGTKEQGYTIKHQTEPKPFGKKDLNQQTDQAVTNKDKIPPVVPVDKLKNK